MKKFLFALVVCVVPSLVVAQFVSYQDEFGQSESLQEYFAESPANYDKSIIYVFFNNNGCYGCPQAMSLMEDIYQKYYANKYSLFLINYQNDEEYNFIEMYDLKQPLEVVMVRINDGAVFGYQKIENLQNQISDITSFEEYVRYRIDSFLGNNG